MILPHKESIDVGHGFAIDIELRDLGPDAIPSIIASWDININLPKFQLVAFYPIELLKKFNKELCFSWRYPVGGGAPADYIHAEWGHPVSAPDPRATTHRHGAADFKTTSLLDAAHIAKKSVQFAATRIRHFLDLRESCAKERELMLNKAKEGLGTPEADIDTEGRFDLLELDMKQ